MAKTRCACLLWSKDRYSSSCRSVSRLIISYEKNEERGQIYSFINLQFAAFCIQSRLITCSINALISSSLLRSARPSSAFRVAASSSDFCCICKAVANARCTCLSRSEELSSSSCRRFLRFNVSCKSHNCQIFCCVWSLPPTPNDYVMHNIEPVPLAQLSLVDYCVLSIQVWP